jgi:organic radical activating enzyme
MEEKGLKADILEIFSSIQGEGPFMGTKQVFIRFAGCNMKCAFCDLEAVFPPKSFTVDKMLSVVKQIRFTSGQHHSVSLTGGEPLLNKDYLKRLLPRLRETGLKIYLETNSTLPANLREVIEFIDIVSADFKLPSSTLERAYWGEHREFIEIAKSRNCFVKIVVTNNTKPEDIERAVDIASSVDKKMLMVIQPVWPVKGIDRVKNRLLFDYLFMAEKKLENVRIMPQMHKVLRAK